MGFITRTTPPGDNSLAPTPSLQSQIDAIGKDIINTPPIEPPKGPLSFGPQPPSILDMQPPLKLPMAPLPPIKLEDVKKMLEKPKLQPLRPPLWP